MQGLSNVFYPYRHLQPWWLERPTLIVSQNSAKSQAIIQYRIFAKLSSWGKLTFLLITSTRPGIAGLAISPEQGQLRLFQKILTRPDLPKKSAPKAGNIRTDLLLLLVIIGDKQVAVIAHDRAVHWCVKHNAVPMPGHDLFV